MARDGFLILDSDLHMMEPDDLWSRYLEGAHRANPPRFFGGQQRKLDTSAADKGNADAIMGMEVQGLSIPAHANASGATASSRELRLDAVAPLALACAGIDSPCTSMPMMASALPLSAALVSSLRCWPPKKRGGFARCAPSRKRDHRSSGSIM